MTFFLKKTVFSPKLFLNFSFKIDNITLDPDPNWAENSRSCSKFNVLVSKDGCLEEGVLELALHVHGVGVGLVIAQPGRHLAQNEDHDLDDLKFREKS